MIIVKEDEYHCNLQAPCFQKLPSEAIETIKENKTMVMFRKGDQLCKQGTFASYILFITKGLAIQYVEGENNKNFNLQFIQPAEFLGLHALFSSQTYDYSATALTDCYAILVEKATLNQIMSNNSLFTMQLMSRYMTEHRSLFQIISQLQFRQMNGRFAQTLLYADSLKASFPDIFKLMSRKQLAEFTGISTESSIKLLKKLEKENILSLNNKDIVIKDYKALKQLKELG